jgi:cation diffusion facilitator CzcD-associated flavoprotein CzcO
VPNDDSERMTPPSGEEDSAPGAKNVPRTPRVAVIGAGPGGLCMGVALRRLGVSEFVIFEQSGGIGGTWWDNSYPGAAVDTPVPFYSFSFHPFDFSRTHVQQPELLKYLQNLADRYQLDEHIRLSTAVIRAIWDESTHTYEIETSDGIRQTFDVVVSAVGLLNTPKYPDWPGLDTFCGSKFHSSRWDRSVDLTGKRVAVVGTGSTSAQIVPAIAPLANQVYVFQRQPGWVLPKGDRDFTALERGQMTRPWRWRLMRFKQYMTYEKSSMGSRIEGTKYNTAARLTCERYIETVFKDRPELQKIVTPDYPFSGKRTIKDSEYYPALLRENVELIPHAVTKVSDGAIIDDTGYSREIDVLIMCTGFQPANFLSTVEIVGRDGQTIHEFWDGDASAYLGLTVAGFPNFYMLYGPNTNGAPVMYMHERQVEFVVSNLKRMVKHDISAIEVRASVMELFNHVLQKRLARTVVANHTDVHNYARSASGRNVIAWVDRLATYSFLIRTTARLSSKSRRLSRGPVGSEHSKV